jgi:tetratricopeptide (TPR) repeat protein
MKLLSNYSLLILIFVVMSNGIFAQSTEEKKILKKARKELTQGNYENAKLAYSNLIKLDDKNALYYFESGLAHYNSYYQRENALEMFNNALAYSKRDTISEIFLYLGKTHQYLNNFSTAIENYNTFKKYTKLNREGSYVLLEVDHLIEMCNNGVSLQENKANENVTAENIGGRINSRYAEYGQVVNSKSDALLFTTRDRENTGDKLYNDNKKYEDIYISTKKDRKWVSKVNVDSANHFFSSKINTKKHDGVIGFSDNDEKLYIYQNNGVLVSTKKDGKYGKPVELKTVNSTGREPSAFLTKDGKTIFFSSSRKGGKGGLDLYYATQQSDGSWSEPVNMSNLNTTLNEDAPYLSNDGKELFFCISRSQFCWRL